MYKEIKQEDGAIPFSALHDWSMTDNEHKLKQKSHRLAISEKKKKSLFGQTSYEAGCSAMLCRFSRPKWLKPFSDLATDLILC